jgi:hypothetical protein
VTVAVIPELRLLHTRSEHGYTTTLRDAMQDEPEAVSEAEQRYQTRQAHRQAAQRQHAIWHDVHGRLDACLAELSTISLAVDITGDVRGLQHRVDKLARRVAAGR